MKSRAVVGIDPGLVHSGVVMAHFDPQARAVQVVDFIAEGDDHVPQIVDLVPGEAETFIEDYRDRGQVYDTNSEMRELLSRLRRELPHASVLGNTGVRKVVKPELLRLLGMWRFRTSNHQDLEAAARIMVFGMLKDEELNRLLASVVFDHLGGLTWQVEHTSLPNGKDA